MANNKLSPSGRLAVHRYKVITASVRTTSRMNALLNESIQSAKKRPIIKLKDIDNNDNEQKNNDKKIEIDFVEKKLTIDHIYELIVETIEERLQWDRFNRMYDPWRTPQFVQTISNEIKDRVKELNYRRHRIVCIVTIMEKRQQSAVYKMLHLMDEKVDNFTNYVYERGTYTIITTVWLIYKD